MAIWGIIGGIGSGKTLTGVTLMLDDLYSGRNLFTNVVLKNVPKRYMEKVTYMGSKDIVNIFELIKTKQLDIRNSTIFFQEAHNYIDSRNSMSKQSKAFSYFILQSRHFGGDNPVDILFDTQNLGQVDIRLRRNLDVLIFPEIIEWERKPNGKKAPSKVLFKGQSFVGQRFVKFQKILDVTKTREQYDTHQLVEF